MNGTRQGLFSERYGDGRVNTETHLTNLPRTFVLETVQQVRNGGRQTLQQFLTGRAGAEVE